MEIQQLIPQSAVVETESAFTSLELASNTPADRPYTICNMVSTADGKATVDGRAGPMSDEVDREIFHLLRTQTDALLVGAGTVRVERYGPMTKNERLLAIRQRDGLRTPQLACIVTNSLELDSEIPLFNDPDSEVVIFTTSERDCPEFRADVTVVRQQGDRVDLAAALATLKSEFGIRTLLCEGGPTLNGELFSAGLLDELFLSLAPKIESGSGIPSIVEGSPLQEITDLNLRSALHHYSSLYLRFLTNRG